MRLVLRVCLRLCTSRRGATANKAQERHAAGQCRQRGGLWNCSRSIEGNIAAAVRGEVTQIRARQISGGTGSHSEQVECGAAGASSKRTFEGGIVGAIERGISGGQGGP